MHYWNNILTVKTKFLKCQLLSPTHWQTSWLFSSTVLDVDRLQFILFFFFFSISTKCFYFYYVCNSYKFTRKVFFVFVFFLNLKDLGFYKKTVKGCFGVYVDKNISKEKSDKIEHGCVNQGRKYMSTSWMFEQTFRCIYFCVVRFMPFWDRIKFTFKTHSLN